MSNKTIQKMSSGGASKQDIAFAKETQYSMDTGHVSRHREYIAQYNPSDPWREPNNFMMHPASYTFGGGHRSPQYIGGMLGQVGPVFIAGPPIYGLPSQIQPHVYYSQQWQ